MRVQTPNYFHQFQCTCGDCPDTCCASWEVILDGDALADYQSLPGPFGDKLRSAICVIDGEHCFKTSSGVCPMLTPEGLCSVHRELGPQRLCRVCRTYPRWVQEYGAFQQRGLSLSCPEAARLLLSQDRSVTFSVQENDAGITGYNTLDPRLYLLLVQVRQALIAIAQNQTAFPTLRACFCLEFAKKVQKCIRLGRYEKAHSLCAQFSSEADLQAVSVGFPKGRRGNSPGQVRHIVRALQSLERLTPQWQAVLQALLSYCQDAENRRSLQPTGGEEAAQLAMQYEHILVYFFDKYTLTACFDRDLLGKVKLAAVSLLLTVHWDMCWAQVHRQTIGLAQQVEFVHRYCRELEHSQENMKKLGRLLRRGGQYRNGRLVQALLDT